MTNRPRRTPIPDTLDAEQQALVEKIIGDELTQLLDRRRSLYDQIAAVDGDIYAALVNRVQSQSGIAMLRPYEALDERLTNHDRRLDKKKTNIADLRMIIEDQERRLKVLEVRLGAVSE